MLAALSVICSLALVNGADIDTVRERFLTSLLPKTDSSGAELAVAVRGILGKFIPSNCTFKGIDYKSDRRASWPVMAHLGYTQEMLAGWRSNRTGSVHNNGTVRAAAVCALNWWLVHKPKCPNWYDQEISGPNNIGQAVLYLGPGSLEANQTKAADQLMAEADWHGWTGSNLVFMARAQIFRGLFLQNNTLIKECFDVVWSSLVVSDQGSDGIQADGSFHQHGAQLLAAHTYGSEFSNHVLEMTMLSADTQWQPDDAPLGHFAGLVLDGQQHMGRAESDHWDFQAAGRSVDTPPGSLGGFSSALVPDWMRALADRPRGDEWVAFANRLDAGAAGSPLVATRVFWDSDFATHATKGYSMSVHMHSKRTIGGACVNEQGKLSQRMSDGTMAVYFKGDEYDGIWPVLDYMRPPGTTTAMNGEKLGCSNAKLPTYKDCVFVGGAASNRSSFGALAMDTHYDGTIHAPRSWMLIPEGSVMLGQTLSAEGNYPLATTLDQRKKTGDVWIGTSSSGGKPVKVTTDGNQSYAVPVPSSGEGSSLRGSAGSMDTLLWVWHGGIAYVLLGDSMSATAPATATPASSNVDTPPTVVQLFTGPKSGDWSRVGVETGNVTLDILDVALYHDTDAAKGKGTFAYAVLPSVESPDDVQAAVNRFTTAPAVGAVSRDDASDLIRVIRPSADGAFLPWHAVLHEAGATLDVVVWEPNAVSAASGDSFSPVSAGPGWSVATSMPCTAVLDGSDDGRVVLTVASPGTDGGSASIFVDRVLSNCRITGAESVECSSYTPPKSLPASVFESQWTEVKFTLPGGSKMVGASVVVTATS